MIRAGLLLAAGASRRFGTEDKLLASLQGRPLIAHAAQAMREAPLERRIAVIANPALSAHLEGFQIVTIPPGAQSDSLRAGLSAAGRPDRLLVALADMPFVDAAHLGRVLSAATDETPSASRDRGPPMPPSCFPASWLDRLMTLEGDRGAGSLIHNLPAASVIPATRLLADIDTASDLKREEAAENDRPSHSFQIPPGSEGGAPDRRGTR